MEVNYFYTMTVQSYKNMNYLAQRQHFSTDNHTFTSTLQKDVYTKLMIYMSCITVFICLSLVIRGGKSDEVIEVSSIHKYNVTHI